MILAAAGTSLFENAKGRVMDKKRIIRILTSSAKLYKEHLEDQKVLFIYGLPAEVKRQLNSPNKQLNKLEYYEVAFYRQNFMHLTGIKPKGNKVKSSIHFYELCLDGRLSEDDFTLSKDGSTAQKMEILEHMMLIKKNVAMIGDFTDRGPKLFSEKAAGGIKGCMGFVEDKYTKGNVPNTLLKKDIRDITAIPVKKIYAVFSKHLTDEKYSVICKLNKEIDIHTYFFPDQVENMICREKI